jgi:hypothetical protein
MFSDVYQVFMHNHFNFIPLSCSVPGEGPNFGISQEEKYAARGKPICRFGEETPYSDFMTKLQRKTMHKILKI